MRRNLLKTGLSIAVLRAVNVVLGFTITIVLGRALGPAGLGIYAYASVLIILATVPVSYGWGTLLLRTTSKGRYDGEWSEARGLAVRGVHYAALIAGLGLVPVLALKMFAPEVLPEAMSPLIIVALLVVLLFDQLSALRTSMLRGMDHNVIAQIPEMVVRPAILISVFLFLLWMLGEQTTVAHAFVALLSAAVINLVLGYVLLWWKASPDLLAADPIYFDRAWLGSAGALATSSGLIIFNVILDILVLGFFVEAADIGIYRVAAQVSLLAGFAYVSLNMLAAPRFAQFRAANDVEGTQVTATFLARLAFVGSLPIPIVLLLAGDWLILQVFGAEFARALVPMIILSLGQCISAIVGMPRSLLVMNGKEKRVMYLTLFAIVANIVLCIILIPAFGLVGAAVATTLAASLWNIALWITARRELGLDTSIVGLPAREGRGLSRKANTPSP